MRSSFIAAAVAVIGSAAASPLVKRSDYAAPPGGDIDILNYALTLEYLERTFYQEGLANYSAAEFAAAGFDATFYANLQEIYVDEQSHVAFLSTALGAKAVHQAKYAFPCTDVKSFVTLSSVLEGVGVSAYIGAAGAIVNKMYLTVAGTILGVEARHASYVRAALGESPFPKPYDTPLDFNSVFSLAAEFIVAFAPEDPPLPFKAFPPLTLAPSTTPYQAGCSPVTFTNAYANAWAKGLVTSSTKVYAVFFSGLDTYYVPAWVAPGNKDYMIDMIPGPNYAMAGELAPVGQVYVVLSTANGQGTDTVSDENIISGVGLLEVLP